jgi:hypothetical protein
VLAMGMTAGSVGAQGQSFLARFDGGICVTPASNGAGPVNPDGTFPDVKLNVVRGVNPGGGPCAFLRHRRSSAPANSDLSSAIAGTPVSVQPSPRQV